MTPGYAKGRRPTFKGRRLTAEILTPSEMDALLDSFSPTAINGIRNRAIVLLMYRAGLKMTQIVGMERRHYARGNSKLLTPPTSYWPEREHAVDASTASALDAWIDVRQTLALRPVAPFFCTTARDSLGHPIYASHLRNVLTRHGNKAGIEKRVTSEGIRKSGESERKTVAESGAMGMLVSYLDDTYLAERYPEPFDRWAKARELVAIDPVGHATRIGHECRDALALFSHDLARRTGTSVSEPCGPVARVRAVIAGRVASETTRELLYRFVAYWRAVSDLAQRQEHGATREGETLTAQDGRRLVFHTLIVMYETDSAISSAG